MFIGCDKTRTYIDGVITVVPLGRSQPEKKYILDTVLAHLPQVTGSEGNMNTYVVQKEGYNGSCSHDEFGQYSNLGTGRHRSFATQDEYIVIVDANLRDRSFAETLKEFSNWICRLSKRLLVRDVFVEVEGGCTKTCLFKNKNNVFSDMFEYPSWSTGGEPNWCEFMMWDHAKDSLYPMMLTYKYQNNAENDDEVERRRAFLRVKKIT